MSIYRTQFWNRSGRILSRSTRCPKQGASTSCESGQAPRRMTGAGVGRDGSPPVGRWRWVGEQMDVEDAPRGFLCQAR